MTRLDRAIAYIAPTVAARRAAARLQLRAMEIAQAYYDGADQGRRGTSIRRSGASADTVSARDLPRLRTGSHDLVRNNPHAKRGIDAIVVNGVATGIAPRFKRGRDTDRALEDLARQTLETTAIDVAGVHDYYGLQALALRTTAESGESLVLRRFTNKLAFPIQFQVLEPDFLDSSRDGATREGGEIVQGKEFDKSGRCTRYWLFPEHPGGGTGSVTSLPVPARDVAHIYRVDRPGQVRGIPWLAPVMLRLSDFDDYENAQLVRQKIAACFAVFRTGGLSGPPAAPASGSKTIEKVEPGMIEWLGAGADVKFASPPQVEGYDEYARVSLRAIAAALGLSYEAFTGDLKGVSFTSGRMGWLEQQRNLDAWRWLMLIPQGCAVMMGWWLEGARLLGHNVDGVTVRHTPPRRDMISPEREVPALTNARRSGQKSLTDILGETGKDLHEHLDELAEEQELLDARGIILDSDARKVSAAGLTQARAGQGPLQMPPTGGDDEDLDDE